jgi:hypothetical protein
VVIAIVVECNDVGDGGTLKDTKDLVCRWDRGAASAVGEIVADNNGGKRKRR